MTKKTILISLLLFAIFSIALTIAINVYIPLDDLEQIKKIIAESKTLGPVLVVALQAIQVVLIPIPGQVTGLVSGYFFGPFLGTLYSMIGLVIGSYIVFYASKKLGRPFVKKIVEEETFKKFDYLSKNTGTAAIFLVFLLPMLPDDAICFISGLTKIKTRTFLLAAISGRLPGCFIANAIGSGLAISTFQTGLIFAFSILVFTVLMYIFRDKVENKMNSYIKNVTKKNDRRKK